MDIAYHYFAVKTLAVMAGFSDDDAQIIAENSQLVDDFDYTAYWHCTNVPDYIKNNPSYDLCVMGGFFNPVQTGFLCDGLMGCTDYLYLAIERGQRFTCTPFHFICQNRDQINKKEYRVTSVLVNNDAIISDLLIDARDSFRGEEVGTRQWRKALMKIGMLLHIFADTVAHQMFSGFNAYVNLVELVNVKNNITGEDETEKYYTSTIKYLNQLKNWTPKVTMAIGHMMLEHIPDLTHLSFAFKYKDGNYEEQIYTRDNTAEFVEISRRILNYLRSCLDLGEVSDDEWKEIATNLQKSFLTDISEDTSEEAMVEHLKEVWNYLECTYHYNSKEIKESFTVVQQPLDKSVETNGIPVEMIPLNSTQASEDFYLFNANADEVLIELYGDHPRRLW